MNRGGIRDRVRRCRMISALADFAAISSQLAASVSARIRTKRAAAVALSEPAASAAR